MENQQRPTFRSSVPSGWLQPILSDNQILSKKQDEGTISLISFNPFFHCLLTP